MTLTALSLSTALATTMGANASAAQLKPALTSLMARQSQKLQLMQITPRLSTPSLDSPSPPPSVLAGAVSPEISNNGGALNIVLDPSSIPGLAEAYAPAGDHSGLTPVKGQDSSGNTVVFPTSGTFTSGFGPRWGTFHNGIDIANPIGTPIYSIMDGEVISSGPAQGFGHWIRIRHDDGTISVYGHMPGDQLLVNVGDRVSAGQQISVIGNEGHSTGPHLHFEVHPGGGAAVDPVPWFAQRGIII